MVKFLSLLFCLLLLGGCAAPAERGQAPAATEAAPLPPRKRLRLRLFPRLT